MKKLLFIGVSVLVFAMSIAAQQPPKPLAAGFLGNISGGTYKNDFFGFSVDFPKDWIVADKESTAAATKIGLDAIRGENVRDNQAIQEALNREVVLINVTKKPIGALRNAVFMMGVRKQMSSSITPSMVAEATKSAFDSSPTMKLVADTQVKTIGDQKFAHLEYELNANGQRARVRFYVTMIREYALSFSFSNGDDDSSRELDKIVASMRFFSR